MIPLEEALAILAEAEALDVKFVETPLPGAKAYLARPPRWSITVVRFTRPDGSFGYDGAAMKDNTVVRMTPEVAERIFARAHRG